MIGKFWKKASNGQRYFTLTSDDSIKVMHLEDIILIRANKIDLCKNPFLDKEYFDRINNNTEIRNITGKYRKIWDIQNGKCFICKKEIRKCHNKIIICKDLTQKPTIKNLAYIHSFCKDSELEYIYCNDLNHKVKNFNELVKEIRNMENKGKQIKKISKFENLKVYFHNVKKLKVSLTFYDIEKILGRKLCSSAYKYKSYFYNNKDDKSISNSWISQGYRITKIDFENKKIYFEKETANKSRVFFEKYLFDRNLPQKAIRKIEECFENVKNEFEL